MGWLVILRGIVLISDTLVNYASDVLPKPWYHQVGAVEVVVEISYRIDVVVIKRVDVATKTKDRVKVY